MAVKAAPMPSLASRRHLLVKEKEGSEHKACFSFSRDFKTLGARLSPQEVTKSDVGYQVRGARVRNVQRKLMSRREHRAVKIKVVAK